MSRIICSIIILSLACSFTSKGQVNLLDKMVQLPKGKITLKAALTILEKQNGCIFSYDPTKIEDKQILNINASTSQTLSVTLKQILPIQIKYKQTGKYIVLQKNTKGQASLLDANLKPLSLSQQEKILSTTIKIKHKADMSTPGDYLMPRPIENKPDSTINKNNPLSAFTINVDSFSTQASKNYAYPSSNLLSNEQNKELGAVVSNSLTTIVKTDTLAKLQNTITKKDTVNTQTKNSFSDFLKNKGVLDLELALNSRLATLSLHAGLYGVYTILSYTKVNNNNTRTGLGIGSHFKIWKNVGTSVELLSNTINNSIAEKIGVNSTLTQLSTELSYTFSNRYKFFIRPNIYIFKSIYTRKATEIIKAEDKKGVIKIEDPIKVEDTKIVLSRNTGIGGVIGISIDLNKLFFKN
jgi:hypothetical protein